jgi:hypothetical protein
MTTAIHLQMPVNRIMLKLLHTQFKIANTSKCKNKDGVFLILLLNCNYKLCMDATAGRQNRQHQLYQKPDAVIRPLFVPNKAA